MNKFIIFLACFILLLPVYLPGQTTAQYIYSLQKISEDLKIDASLDEKAWGRSAKITNLIQLEPSEGNPASEKTEISVLYNDNFLYIGIVCFDSEPKKIVANEMRRDAELKDNDYFDIFLDTYHDHRNAFYFAINPLGARRDAQIRDEGMNINWNWDGIWNSRAKITPVGWIAEIAIPLRTLRFKPDEEQSWGINFGRHIARKREESYWSPILRSSGWFGRFRVSNCGHLLGLTGLKPGKRGQLMPYILGGLIQDGPEENLNRSIDTGIDLKYRLTPNLTADLTINTDFAQVEADQEQFNLSRFSLFFPEKRGFFLEGADIFKVGERYNEYEPPTTLLFFSRNIGLSEDGDEIPIMAGVRVTGKTGNYNVGLMNITANRIQDTGRTNFSVMRLKRDFLKKSTFGLMYLSKNDLDGYDYNRTAALDFNLALGQSLKVQGFTAKTATPGKEGRDWAALLDCSYNDDFWSLEFAYTDIGENFNSEMGFISRTDIRKFKGNIGIGPRPGFLNLRKTFLFANLLYIENHAGLLESRTSTLGMFNIFQNGSQWFMGFVRNYEYLSEEFEISDDVFIPEKSHSFNMFASFFESDKSKKFAMRGEVTAGGFYNGHLFRLNATGFLKFGKNINLEFILDRNQFDLPVPEGKFSTTIAAGRLVYSFTPDLYAKAYLQWNSERELFKSNFLIRWIYRPGANIYLIYNETREFEPTNILNDRILMLKVSFLFNF